MSVAISWAKKVQLAMQVRHFDRFFKIQSHLAIYCFQGKSWLNQLQEEHSRVYRNSINMNMMSMMH